VAVCDASALSKVAERIEILFAAETVAEMGSSPPYVCGEWFRCGYCKITSVTCFFDNQVLHGKVTAQMHNMVHGLIFWLPSHCAQ